MGDVLSFELEARRLLKLSKDAADSLMRGGINPLLEYVEAKREFRKKFADESSIMAIRDPNERNNLKRLLRGETPVDRIINAMGGTSNTDTQYEFDELSELASDLFYSWFCGEDYVEAMINIDRALLENPPPTCMGKHLCGSQELSRLSAIPGDGDGLPTTSRAMRRHCSRIQGTDIYRWVRQREI